MKQFLKYSFLAAVAVMFAACDFLNVPDNGPVIKGDQVAAVKLNPQQQDSMDKIFSLSNPVMKARVETLKNDKNSKNVYLIGSQSELLALCSDVLTPPEIDFKHHVVIYGLVALPTSQGVSRKVELYLQNNGDATFYAEILATSVDPLIGMAIPYGVFEVSEVKIKHLDMQSRTVFY